MITNNFYRTVVATILAVGAGITGTAYAVPGLQLDANGGSYVGGNDETTYCASGNTCDIYALATPQNQNFDETKILSENFYVSIALVPQTGPVGSSLGSFDVTIGGVTTTVTVTDDMVYGVPPLETVMSIQGMDPGDLAQHGIFETYFYQATITFDMSKQLAVYNAADDAGHPLDHTGTGMFYEVLSIDTTNLDPAYTLHFDLYDQEVVACGNNPNCVAGDIDVDDFAPFSHDAQTTSSSTSSTGGQTSTSSSGQAQVAEPSTLSLLGLSLLGTMIYRRRRSQMVA